jgi:CubicO group peptidase (beta-lactamase class C family)
MFMKKFLSIFISLLLIFSVTGTPALAQNSQEIRNELNNMVDSMSGPGHAKGAVLSIVKNGRIELCQGYGFADEYNGIAADGEKTAFRIGSVSKTFVAVAAQILHQEGRLDMNRDISVYLDSDFPTLSYPVTMHQLLTHTAGFEDRVTGMAVRNVSDTEPLAASVRQYLPAQVFKPGEVVSYSNYGIALAAYVVECITDQDFAQYCREQVFLPLGMTRTTFEHMHDVVYVSKPYLPSGEETLEPYMNLYPEGSAVSTAGDMAKYMQWLLDNEDTRVLTARSKEEIFSRQFSMSEELEGVGYTWNRKTRNHAVYYDKKGETLHFYTRIALFPQEQTGVFLSFNTYLPEHEIDAVIQKAADLLYGEATRPAPGSGAATIDISGHYANNWSSFKTPEKILRYLVPGKMLHISGSQDSGYFINDDRLTLIGADTYASNMGILKFQKKAKTIMLATESAITYSKLPFWQQSYIQLFMPLLFFIIVLTFLFRELIRLLQKKKTKHNPILLVCSLVQFLSFCALCLLIYKGIATFSLLAFALYMKIFGWLILVACASALIYTIYVKPKNHTLNLLPIIWNLSGILFCIWMFLFNIL